MRVEFRKIRPEDNPKIASVIRSVLKEHGVDKPGTVFTDPTTDNLYELFQTANSIYWIAVENNKIIGGCGIFPTSGLPTKCSELVKLYVSKEARGNKIGYTLMEMSINSAKELGYESLYLETLPELAKAVSLYERLGFKALSKPLGASGHFACDIWMLKDLSEASL